MAKERPRDIFSADRLEWKAWMKLTPAQRLDECCRQWISTYKVRENAGKNLSMADHIMDSCNYVGKDPLTWLLFPFAIQYHALHHMFPALPYHNLAFAHSYLMRKLPDDSPYRDLTQPGWWSVARNMLRQDQPTVELSDRQVVAPSATGPRRPNYMSRSNADSQLAVRKSRRV